MSKGAGGIRQVGADGRGATLKNFFQDLVAYATEHSDDDDDN